MTNKYLLSYHSARHITESSVFILLQSQRLYRCHTVSIP